MTIGCRFVFLHGGPGFDSSAEQAILEPGFAARGQHMVCWTEPSRFRPAGDAFEASGACEGWLTSAERFTLDAAGPEPIHVIAHSFTVHAATEIARRHPDRVAGLVLAAPAMDPIATFRNVMQLAREDLAGTKPEIADAIAACLGRTHAFFDDGMREGLENVLHDEQLFTHYWADAAQMEASLAARARAGAQFDVESFFAVLDDFVRRGPTLFSSGPVSVPTLVLFGGQDRITPVDEHRAAIEATIPGARIDVLDGCSHYVHLDRPAHFAEVVVDWATGSSKSLRRY